MMISGKNFTCAPPSKAINEKTEKTRLPKITKQVVSTQQQHKQQQQHKPLKSKPIKTTVPKNDKGQLPITKIVKSVEEPIIKEDESNINVYEKAVSLLSSPNGSTGSIRIKFNHYNKSFPIYNGVLKWCDVDK